jgi:uncharacterized alkaline shock family protein YloU
MSATANLPASKNQAETHAPGNGLATDHGNTTISDDVVSKVAEMSAREIRGVHDLSGGVAGTLRRLTPGFDERGAGASVEVGEKETVVDLNLVVDYGVSIPQLADAVRENVIDRVEYTTGLRVKEVNIDVSDLFFVEEERRKQAQSEREQTPRVQ